MGIVDWSKAQDPRSLITLLQEALIKIFGKEFLESEIKRFREFSPKGKPETLEFLRPYKIHRATKWFILLENLKERGYSFDLRFSTEIEEFMNLLLFMYGIDLLVQREVLKLENKQIEGALTDSRRFESLIYEIIVAANYISNNFEVELPDVLGKGNVDVHARKGGVDVYCECKRLQRWEEYAEIAIETMKKLYEKKMNLIVDIELGKIPKTGGGKADIEKLVKIIENIIDKGIKSYRDQSISIHIIELPEHIQGIYEVSVPQPETIENVISTSYIGIFDGVLQVKEPKLVIVRDPYKRERVSKQLVNALKEAYDRLSKVNVDRAHKVIYIDISEPVGKPTSAPGDDENQYRPEILASHLETLCKDWLISHRGVDAVVLTHPKLYVDELDNPFLLNVESGVVVPFTAPGWAVEIQVIPIPRDVPPEVLVNLGVEAAKKGNYRLAYIYYRRAIEMRPDIKEAYNNLGRLLTDMGRPDEALKYLDKALELDPNYVSALINKGIALVGMGMLNEALEHLNKATDLDLSNEKAWYNKVLIHYMLERLEKALEETLRALAINPDYEPTKKLKEEIEKTLKKSSPSTY